MYGGFFMDEILFEKDIALDEGKITNLSIADQKNCIENHDNFHVVGQIFIDISLLKDENSITQHAELPLDLTLSKRKYNLKNFDLKIFDYHYEQNERTCHIKIIYQICGEDLSLEKFCSLDDNELSYQLRDYLNLNLNDKRCLNIAEDEIKILDPVIIDTQEEVKISESELRSTPIEVVDNLEKTQLNQDETKIEEKITPPIDDEQKEDTINKKELFKESYSLSFIYYRICKDDDLTKISTKFNIDKEKIIAANPNKEFKANTLILIPHV